MSGRLVIVGMRSLLQMASDSSAVDGPLLNVFQRACQTDFPLRTGQTCILERVERSPRLGPMLGSICIIRIAFIAYGLV